MKKHRNCHLATILSCLLFPLAATADVNNEANISTGRATEGGVVTTYITLQKTVSGITFTQYVHWNTQITKGDDASTKAGKIRSSAPRDRDEMDNISGDANTVRAKAKDGWTITSMVFSKDATKESHTHNLFSSFDAFEHTGVFSLTGDSVATGLDSDGGQGHIDVSLLGEMIRVDTLPGMTGDDMEGLIVIELVALELESSLEGPGPWMDKFDFYSGAQHDDQMVFLHELDSLGLTIEVADTGLEFDASGLFIPTPGTLLLLGTGGLTALRRRR